MFKFIIFSVLAIMASAQYNRDPKTAAILSEQRYLSGNGQFGAAYTQEDGTDFKEETDADGTRHGSYSYIDPNGQKKTISYTAGKDGFRASGDHLPVAPAPPPHAAPQPQYQPQSQSQYQPQYNQPQYSASNSNDYDDGSYDPRYNDPSFSQGSSYRAPAPAPAPVYTPAPTHAPQPQYHQPQHQPQYRPQQQYNPPQQQYTTESSHRFQPPGKLSLNRTPDGFSYSFNKA